MKEFGSKPSSSEPVDGALVEFDEFEEAAVAEFCCASKEPSPLTICLFSLFFSGAYVKPPVRIKNPCFATEPCAKESRAARTPTPTRHAYGTRF